MSKKLNEMLKDSQLVEAKKDNDTIRLWENYKEQALLWRSIALLELPTTLIAVVFALVMWHTRHITLNVPRQPLPGIYSVEEIPDEVFAEFATNFVNLIATYTPANARTQFLEARKMLSGEVLAAFDTEALGNELKAIENTSRTQVFFVDPTQTQIKRERGSGTITLKLVGDRLKIISEKSLPVTKTEFKITMNVKPRNTLNPYGIQIVGTSNETPTPK